MFELGTEIQIRPKVNLEPENSNDISQIVNYFQKVMVTVSCPSAGSRLDKRAFAFRGAKIFNSLPKVIRDTESLSGFKRRIFKNIFNS